MNPEYKPILVIDKDTGNTWEFDDISKARECYNKLCKENWGADIRMMKQNIFTGEFIKWLS
jgi:hypothetical protein